MSEKYEDLELIKWDEKTPLMFFDSDENYLFFSKSDKERV